MSHSRTKKKRKKERKKSKIFNLKKRERETVNFRQVQREKGFPGGSDGKESTCGARDLGSIPGLGRSPGGGHGNPLQYSCLENPSLEYKNPELTLLPFFWGLLLAKPNRKPEGCVCVSRGCCILMQCILSAS